MQIIRKTVKINELWLSHIIFLDYLYTVKNHNF